MITIAVDAMGGNKAPAAIVDGAVQFARRTRSALTLVGSAARLKAELGRHADAGQYPVSSLMRPTSSK